VSELTPEEQIEIDAALHDGEGWALPNDMPEALAERLEAKGMIRMHEGRWQLTPAGFSRSLMFR
jgi:hypothetical protein